MVEALPNLLRLKVVDENQRLGCVNRDYNALERSSMNMKKIFNYYLQTGNRLLKYKRGYDLKKSSNPKMDNLLSCQIDECSSIECNYTNQTKSKFKIKNETQKRTSNVKS